MSEHVTILFGLAGGLALFLYGMNSMSTVKEAFDAWMNSPPHRENILNPDVRYMACAKATKSENGEYTYWEQLFYSDI